jgi:hypothetical protein
MPCDARETTGREGSSEALHLYYHDTKWIQYVWSNTMSKPKPADTIRQEAELLEARYR